jgi:hypothetical protein
VLAHGNPPSIALSCVARGVLALRANREVVARYQGAISAVDG